MEASLALGENCTSNCLTPDNLAVDESVLGDYDRSGIGSRKGNQRLPWEYMCIEVGVFGADSERIVGWLGSGGQWRKIARKYENVTNT